MQPLAGAVVWDGRVEPPRLDDRGDHRHPEIAGGLDVVLAPEHQPERHRVLGEVRVGPLVDVVRQAVAPRLEELRRGPRVVDLVEVHLVRLGEAEGPQRHRGQDQDDQEPQVEPVEAAAALAGQRAAPVGPDRSARRAAGGTIRSARARPSSGAATRWASRRPRRGAAAAAPAGSGVAPAATRRRRAALGRMTAPGRRPASGRGRRVERPPAVARRRHRARARAARGRPRAAGAAPRRTRSRTRPRPTAMAGSDLRVGPIPSQSDDLRVVGDQHVEDHVHVREQAEAQDART